MKKVIKLAALELNAHALSEMGECNVIQLNRTGHVIYVLALASL